MLENIQDGLTVEALYILRIVVSSLCGGLIGFERSRRQKDAGIRTHIIVALGSALIMVISKYGFEDIVVSETMKFDASRIASNVVTGVSFLGAGVIFIKEQSIKGLTTAAGIWATAGVGLAIGAGLYFVGITATALLIVIQLILHKYASKLEGNYSKSIYIEVDNAGSRSFEIGAIINRFGASLHSLEILYADGKTGNRKSDSTVLRAVVFPKNENSLNLITSSIRALEGVRDLYVE